MSQEPFILYIDDERPTLDLVAQALKLVGYNISGVTSGEQGLALMRQHKPDLLLLDLMMPHFSGWDVYRAMKTDEFLADIPVIIITARVLPQELTLIEGLPPVNDYLTKPFDVQSLIRAIQRLLPPA
ncbi:MAG: response regulator [Anaerolineales bacterium]|nr:response regulator [Anaerolineales bacterium]